MPAEYDNTFEPPRTAPIVWADARNLYAALILPNGCDYHIMTLPRNSIGLSKLLAVIYGNADIAGPATPYIPTRKLIGTPTQHASALAALRRAGIIK